MILAPKTLERFYTRSPPDNLFIHAKGDILQKEGAAVKDGVNLVEAAVVLCEEMRPSGNIKPGNEDTRRTPALYYNRV